MKEVQGSSKGIQAGQGGMHWHADNENSPGCGADVLNSNADVSRA